MNPRSVKRNGTLHSLCEFHRTKANRIQQAYAAKKRMRTNQGALETTLDASMSDGAAEVLDMNLLNSLLLMDECDLSSHSIELTAEEHEILCNLF